MAWKALLLGQLALAAAQESGKSMPGLEPPLDTLTCCTVRVVTVIVHKSCGVPIGFPTTLDYPTSELH